MSQSHQKKSKRKITAADLEALEQINLDAAGLDVGDDEIYACVPKGRDPQTVRVFATFTIDLFALADWLEAGGITTVALESTGVYWIPAFQILDNRGFELILVNAHALKSLTAKKSDVLDCQWIQQLHTYGLLRASFQPDDQTRTLRALVRHRQNLLHYRGSHIQHIHKALQLMNLKLNNVLSNITGVTGFKIIRAILAGERDPYVLAQFRDVRCRHSVDEIAKSLQGDFRHEHILSLRHAVRLFDTYTDLVHDCDQQIEAQFAAFSPLVDIHLKPLAPRRKRKSSRRKNDPRLDTRSYLYQIAGVDLTAIDGLDEATLLTIVSETGVDMSHWPSAKHFASWLCLCPHNHTSAGKTLRSRTRKTSSPANNAFRLAARSLKHSDSALGNYFRRMRAKLGPAGAVVATAHKLARIFYHMLKHQVEFEYMSSAQAEAQYRQRALRNLQRRARKLGATVVLDPT